MAVLQQHAWPGNVRELANIVERLTILHPGQLVSAAETSRLLEGGATVATKAAATSEGGLTERLDEFERTLIIEALDAADGSVADAARRLQTDRANLYRRMRRLDILR